MLTATDAPKEPATLRLVQPDKQGPDAAIGEIVQPDELPGRNAMIGEFIRLLPRLSDDWVYGLVTEVRRQIAEHLRSMSPRGRRPPRGH